MAIQGAINQLVGVALAANKLRQKDVAEPKAPESSPEDVSKMKVASNPKEVQSSRNPGQNLMQVSSLAMTMMSDEVKARYDQRAKVMEHIKASKTKIKRKGR